MNTFEASHCKPGTHVCLYEDLGTVLGHHTDELSITWIEIQWQNGSRTELPVTDCADLQKARQLVHFEPTEIYAPPPSPTPERGKRHS